MRNYIENWFIFNIDKVHTFNTDQTSLNFITEQIQNRRVFAQNFFFPIEEIED